MLKCGQKDNKKYTFGVRKEQMEEKEDNMICCAFCGGSIKNKDKFCSSCGEKV